MLCPIIKNLAVKNIDNPKFTQTAKSNLENKDSKTGVLNLQGCKGLKVDIIDFRYTNVTSIGTGAFEEMKSKRVIFSHTVKQILPLAFYNSEIDEVHLEKTKIEKIPYQCFFNFKGKIFLPHSVKTLENGCFQNANINNVLDLSNLKTLTEIPWNCFNNFKGKNIIFPASLEKIEISAFQSCTLEEQISLENTKVSSKLKKQIYSIVNSKKDKKKKSVRYWLSDLFDLFG